MEFDTILTYVAIVIAVFLIICYRDPNVPLYIKARFDLAKLNFHRWWFGISLKWQLSHSLGKFKREIRAQRAKK